MQLVHIAGQATAPDVNRADIKLAQPGGELLLRSGVDDPQCAPERGSQRHVSGEEGDLVIDLPRP